MRLQLLLVALAGAAALVAADSQQSGATAGRAGTHAQQPQQTTAAPAQPATKQQKQVNSVATAAATMAAPQQLLLLQPPAPEPVRGGAGGGAAQLFLQPEEPSGFLGSMGMGDDRLAAQPQQQQQQRPAAGMLGLGMNTMLSGRPAGQQQQQQAMPLLMSEGQPQARPSGGGTPYYGGEDGGWQHGSYEPQRKQQYSDGGYAAEQYGHSNGPLPKPYNGPRRAYDSEEYHSDDDGEQATYRPSPRYSNNKYGPRDQHKAYSKPDGGAYQQYPSRPSYGASKGHGSDSRWDDAGDSEGPISQQRNHKPAASGQQQRQQAAKRAEPTTQGTPAAVKATKPVAADAKQQATDKPSVVVSQPMAVGGGGAASDARVDKLTKKRQSLLTPEELKAIEEFYKHKFQPPHAPDTPKVGQEGSDDTPDSTSGAGVSRGHQDEQRHSRQHRDDSSAGYDEPSYDERPGQYNKGRGDAPYERKGHDSYYAPRGNEPGAYKRDSRYDSRYDDDDDHNSHYDRDGQYGGAYQAPYKKAGGSPYNPYYSGGEASRYAGPDSDGYTQPPPLFGYAGGDDHSSSYDSYSGHDAGEGYGDEEDDEADGNDDYGNDDYTAVHDFWRSHIASAVCLRVKPSTFTLNGGTAVKPENITMDLTCCDKTSAEKKAHLKKLGLPVVDGLAELSVASCAATFSYYDVALPTYGGQPYVVGQANMSCSFNAAAHFCGEVPKDLVIKGSGLLYATTAKILKRTHAPTPAYGGSSYSKKQHYAFHKRQYDSLHHVDPVHKTKVVVLPADAGAAAAAAGQIAIASMQADTAKAPHAHYDKGHDGYNGASYGAPAPSYYGAPQPHDDYGYPAGGGYAAHYVKPRPPTLLGTSLVAKVPLAKRHHAPYGGYGYVSSSDGYSSFARGSKLAGVVGLVLNFYNAEVSVLPDGLPVPANATTSHAAHKRVPLVQPGRVWLMLDEDVKKDDGGY